MAYEIASSFPGRNLFTTHTRSANKLVKSEPQHQDAVRACLRFQLHLLLHDEFQSSAAIQHANQSPAILFLSSEKCRHHRHLLQNSKGCIEEKVASTAELFSSCRLSYLILNPAEGILLHHFQEL